MANRVDIHEGDLETLVGCVRYAISKFQDSDPKAAEFLQDELEAIQSRIANEQKGAEVAQEIDAILHFISDGERDDP